VFITEVPVGVIVTSPVPFCIKATEKLLDNVLGTFITTFEAPLSTNIVYLSSPFTNV